MLAAALDEHKPLSGDAVDLIIANAETVIAQEAEQQRRRAWRKKSDRSVSRKMCEPDRRERIAKITPVTGAAVSRDLVRGKKNAACGRVEVWRGSCRPNISVAASFVWRCLTSSTIGRSPKSVLYLAEKRARSQKAHDDATSVTASNCPPCRRSRAKLNLFRSR
jgi:hypothetical protein